MYFAYHINSRRKHRTGKPQVCCWTMLFGRKIQYRSTIDRYEWKKILRVALLCPNLWKLYRFYKAIQDQKNKENNRV